jgi:multidrug efflux pump subunit AcrA (membrane-fusion protein)
MTMDVELPREQENHVLAQRRESNEWDRLQATARLGLEHSRMELAKARLNLRRQEENHEKLQADKEALTVRAPESGVAVPGAFGDGKWQGLDEMTKALQPGRKAPAKQVLWTIVRPGALGATLTVDEATVWKVHEGQAGSAVPTALPDVTIPVRLARVARFSGDGKFRVELALAGGDERLMPGYGAKVKVELETKPNALTVPQGAVSKDGDKTFVHVWQDGKAAPKAVKTGATSDGRVEILDGLEGDEKVLEKAPKS